MFLGEVAGLESVDRGKRDGEGGSSLTAREGESSRCGDFGHVTLSIPSVSVAFTSDSLITLSNKWLLWSDQRGAHLGTRWYFDSARKRPVSKLPYINLRKSERFEVNVHSVWTGLFCIGAWLGIRGLSISVDDNVIVFEWYIYVCALQAG